MIDELLNNTGVQLDELDAIAFGKGPGSFTGIRIATGIAQGLAFSAGLPVIPVSSLAALAESVNNKADYIITAIDARMGEVYFGLYRTGAFPVLISEEKVLKPDQIVLDTDGTLYGTGSGWKTYEAVLRNIAGEQLQGFEGEKFPDAVDILSIAVRNFNAGETVSPEYASPSYIRNQVTR